MILSVASVMRRIKGNVATRELFAREHMRNASNCPCVYITRLQAQHGKKSRSSLPGSLHVGRCKLHVKDLSCGLIAFVAESAILRFGSLQTRRSWQVCC